MRESFAQRYNTAGRDDEQGELCMDLIQISKELGFGFSGQAFSVRNVLVKDASFGDAPLDFSYISFRDCLFQRLEIDVSAEISELPKFRGCYVGTLDGRISQMDLPEGFSTRIAYLIPLGRVPTTQLPSWHCLSHRYKGPIDSIEEVVPSARRRQKAICSLPRFGP